MKESFVLNIFWQMEATQAVIHLWSNLSHETHLHYCKSEMYAIVYMETQEPLILTDVWEGEPLHGPVQRKVGGGC